MHAIAISQLSPEYPAWHWQPQSPVVPVGDALFWHGFPFAPAVHSTFGEGDAFVEGSALGEGDVSVEGLALGDDGASVEGLTLGEGDASAEGFAVSQ